MRIIAFSILGFILINLLACGDSGKKERNTQPQTTTDPDPVATDDEYFLHGRLLLDTDAKPALGFEVWLLDYANSVPLKSSVDESGVFKIPVENLASEGLYSLHIVEGGSREVAVADFSSTVGLQPGFRYHGGIGHDLGAIVLPTNARGLVALSEPHITLTLGGSFSEDVSADLTGFPTVRAPAVASWQMLPTLHVDDPLALLRGFHLRQSFPTLYALEVGEYSGLHIEVSGSGDGSILRVQVESAGHWIESAGVALGNSPRLSWGELLYVLAKEGDMFSAQVSPYTLLQRGELIQARIFLREGEDQTQTLWLGHVLITPPLVQAISLSGGTPAVIDYTSSSLANGLTKPFCLTGDDVIFDIAPPTARGEGMSFDSMSASLTYYNGNTQVEVTDQSFESPYDENVEWEEQGLAYHWGPANQKVSLTLGENDQLSTFRMRLPSQVFPASGGEALITKVRVLIGASIDGVDLASSVMWLKSCAF